MMVSTVISLAMSMGSLVGAVWITVAWLPMITVVLGIALTTQVKGMSEKDSDKSEIGGDVD